MAEEKKVIEVEVKPEDKKVVASRVKKGRKTINYLQKCKNEGKKLVQVCPANRDHYFAMAAEMADCDILRLTALGENPAMQIANAPWWIRTTRNAAQFIHINFYMQTPTYCDKSAALKNGSEYMMAGANSLLPMGVSNETLKYMADNYLVVFGHVGALSGWQTDRQGGYKKMAKTAEEAMKVVKMAYEYQENGMMAMTIELVPGEVTSALAKKLRVPVIGIASGATGGEIDCDGYEMVDFDTFNMMPSLASHAVAYADFFKWAVGAYTGWANDVRTGNYPQEKHGWHMDPAELEKFTKLMEQL